MSSFPLGAGSQSGRSCEANGGGGHGARLGAGRHVEQEPLGPLSQNTFVHSRQNQQTNMCPQKPHLCSGIGC